MNPTKQQKLKELLSQLDNFGKKETPVVPSFQMISSATLKDLTSKLSTLDVAPIVQSVKELQLEMIKSEQDLRAELEDKIASLPYAPDLTKDVKKIRTDFDAKLQILEEENLKTLNIVEEKLQTFIENTNKTDALTRVELEKKLKELRADVISRTTGGGSMNRQIRVEGVDVLTRYTDINIYGVSSSVITSIDNTNKRVNIGIQGGGGAASTLALQTNGTPNVSQSLLNLAQGTNITVADNGSGTVTISASAGSVVAGITRVASIISVSSTLAAATLTDYVVFANVGINVTLPTAISNSNLYTVKNISASSVLISTTAGQTIDGSTSALMPVQNQTLGFMSNASVWQVV